MATHQSARRGSVDPAFRLDGQVALVTGAGRGLGRACAFRLGAAGATVAVNDVDAATAKAVVSELRAGGADASVQVFDVADEAAIVKGFAAVARRYRRLDILVNNAGIVGRAPSEELELATWEKVLAVNLTGLFLCSREAARHMERLGQGGAIVNMASIMGLAGGPFYPNPAYHASKGGVVNLTRAQAIEWGPKGIRVNAVAPTWVSTPLTEKLLASEEMRSRILSGTPLGRLPAAEDIANAVVFLASPAAAFITGQILAVDAGWMAG